MTANLGAGQGIFGWDSGGGFSVPKAERRRFIKPVLKWFGAGRHGRAGKGVFLGDIERMTLLVRPYRNDGSCRTGTAHTQPRLHPPFYRHGRGRAGRNGYPFALLGFLADNGSKYINYQVAGLLETLRAEFTTSRPRHSNDIARRSPRRRSCAQTSGLCSNRLHGAGLVNDFCSNHLNPYVNFHRPCFFSETITDAKGKEQKRDGYEEMKTLYEKLKSIPMPVSISNPHHH